MLASWLPLVYSMRLWATRIASFSGDLSSLTAPPFILSPVSLTEFPGKLVHYPCAFYLLLYASDPEDNTVSFPPFHWFVAHRGSLLINICPTLSSILVWEARAFLRHRRREIRRRQVNRSLEMVYCQCYFPLLVLSPDAWIKCGLFINWSSILLCSLCAWFHIL